LQLCFGQSVDIEILTLLRSKVDEVGEAIQTWILRNKQVLKLFYLVTIHPFSSDIWSITEPAKVLSEMAGNAISRYLNL
jgi:hypothetical protein